MLDTLNRSLAGSESNDKDMALYIRAADAIREAFKCAVIIVHHCGVEGTRPRGHTSLTGAVDAQLAVKRDATENVIVTVEWMKDGAEGDVIASRLERVEIGTDADGDVVSSCVVVPAEASESTRRPSGTSRLTKAAQTALRALVEAIDEQGMAAPASNHIPASARIVTLNIWRQQAYRRGISRRGSSKAASVQACVRVFNWRWPCRRLGRSSMAHIVGEHRWRTTNTPKGVCSCSFAEHRRTMFVNVRVRLEMFGWNMQVDDKPTLGSTRPHNLARSSGQSGRRAMPASCRDSDRRQKGTND